MASGALFGGQASRSQSKHLLEFKAGKMFMKGKMVHPDKRKGSLYIYQSDDSLMHFCWRDRSKSSSDAEDDLIIFPDDVEFKKVAACTTGRVFVLKFKASTRKMLFWMQEPKTDKDEEYCRKLNDFLNNPPAPGSSRGGGGGGGLPAELAAGLGGGSDISSLLTSMTHQDLVQLLGPGGVGGLSGLSALMGGRPSSGAPSESAPPSRVQSSPGPRTTTADSSASQPRPVTAAALPSQPPSTASSGPATTVTTGPAATEGATPTASSSAGKPATAEGGKDGGKPPIQLADLKNILSGMDEPKSLDLSQILTKEDMVPILSNAEIQERLLPFLPDGESLPRTREELTSTFSTPQFQQAMSTFSAALASGQLGPLMGQFGLGDDVTAAAASGDVEGFAKAMQAALAKKAAEPEDVEMKEEDN